jgi:hypothetical protein
MLSNDDRGSTEHFAVSFHDTVGFFFTSWINVTFSFTVNFLLFNAMAFHYFKITSRNKQWYLNAVWKEPTVTTPSWLWEGTKNGQRQPHCLPQISKMHALLICARFIACCSKDYLELHNSGCVQFGTLKRIPLDTKTRSETHIGIKVSYLKCR